MSTEFDREIDRMLAIAEEHVARRGGVSPLALALVHRNPLYPIAREEVRLALEAVFDAGRVKGRTEIPGTDAHYTASTMAAEIARLRQRLRDAGLADEV